MKLQTPIIVFTGALVALGLAACTTNNAAPTTAPSNAPASTAPDYSRYNSPPAISRPMGSYRGGG